MPHQSRDTASTFAKGLAVLAAFDGARPGLTLADIARATGQDRATARRGALTLVQLGYLAQDAREFRLTAKVLMLAGGFLQANRFGRQVQPVLNRHAAALGHEITLAVREADAVLLVAQSTVQAGPVSYGFTLGSRLPLLHTSLGRMLLACESGQAAALAAAAPLHRHTEAALADRGAILERIEAARRDGFCVTDGEFENGITGFAVPVSRPGARGVAAGASRPRGAAAPADREAVLQALQVCASELNQNGAAEALQA